MTDNEIIKALECCANGKCFECGFFDEASEEEPCQDVATRNALSLINRQKAEIERLNNHIADVGKKVKADAVKEFAERLKAKFDKYGAEHYYYSLVDDVAKEMGVGSNDV